MPAEFHLHCRRTAFLQRLCEHEDGLVRFAHTILTGPAGLEVLIDRLEQDVPLSADRPVFDVVAEGLGSISDLVAAYHHTAVDVATDASKVVLTCGSSRFTLLTLPVEDYPALPAMPGASGSLRGDAFATAVAQVSIAAGRDDTLPVLTGVRLEIEGEKITMAATDRYRLAVRDLAWTPEQTGLSVVALVPARTLSETAKSLASADKVTLALASATGGAGEGLVGFEGAGRRTTSRLLDGEFPKYRSLLPAESQGVATVETDALIESVRRVALVAERNTPIRLSFVAGELTLEAGTGDEAQASESLDARLEGDDISIAFNPGYLLDGLGALATAHAELRFTVPTRPAVLAGKADADGVAGDDYRYLLMPVRLSG